VDTGTLTKASELLGVSHSGLSKAMAVLQDELGIKVFVPKGRGLELTEKGRMLYDKSQKILEMIDSVKTNTEQPEKILRIGFPELLALAVTESVTSELKDGLTIENIDSEEIEARVLDQKNDFGFTFIPFPHKDLDHLKIGTVTLSSFCRSGSLQGQDPTKVPYVIPAADLKENVLSIRIRDGWNSNLPRHSPYRANSLSIALKMAQSGACAIYLPSFLVAHLNDVGSKSRQFKELDLPAERRRLERTHRDIFLVKRSHDEESKVMKKVVKIVRKICLSRLDSF
jgi:DNA-binding transcriptional LysR family regulator